MACSPCAEQGNRIWQTQIVVFPSGTPGKFLQYDAGGNLVEVDLPNSGTPEIIDPLPPIAAYSLGDHVLAPNGSGSFVVYELEFQLGSNIWVEKNTGT